MSILFAGGEVEAFYPSDNGIFEDTADSSYDPAFARCAIVSYTQLSYAETVHLGGKSDLWFRADYKHRLGTNNPILTFVNSSNVEVVRLYFTGTTTSGTIQIQYLLTGVWTNYGSPITLNFSTRQTLDVHIDVTNGTIDLYVSNTLRISASGSLAGITDVSYARLGSCA